MPGPAEDGRFDGLYMNLAQQNQGIDNLLESFFGFLRRRTDFFTGASQSMLEESLLKVSFPSGYLGCRENFLPTSASTGEPDQVTSRWRSGYRVKV